MTSELTLALEKLTTVAQTLPGPNAKVRALEWIAAVREGKVYSPEELQGNRELDIVYPTKIAARRFPARSAVMDSSHYLRKVSVQPAMQQFADAIRDYGIVVKETSPSW